MMAHDDTSKLFVKVIIAAKRRGWGVDSIFMPMDNKHTVYGCDDQMSILLAI